METVTSHDGTAIAVEAHGSGPPLLLVHGTTADHTRWAEISPRFQEHFTVVAMDRRGRGGSGDGPDYHILREAEDVAAVVDALGEPTRVLAHSYGAMCTLEASRLTNGISKMVLYEPPLPTGAQMYPPGLPERMEALIAAGDNEAALRLFLRELVGMPGDELDAYRQQPAWPGRVARVPTIPRELGFARDYSFDAEGFAEMTVPTLLLLGGDSPPLFRNADRALQGVLPNLTVRVMPGQRHIAMDLDPDMFTAEVLAFL